MLTTVRLSPFALRSGKRITLNIGKQRITLSADSPQLDLKGLELLALERSLISGEIRGYVAAKMLTTVPIQDDAVQMGNPVAPGAAGGIKPLMTTEQSTASGPDTGEGAPMTPEPPQQSPQLLSGGNIVQRNESEAEAPPVPLKPDAEPLGDFAPDASKIASVKAPADAAATGTEEVTAAAPVEAPVKDDAKTGEAAPAWKADKTLVQQEAVLTASEDKVFLASVAADPNEGDRLKLVAEKRLQSL